MKASEMTNDELCFEIEDGARNLARPYSDILREAAARLRLKQQSDNYAAAMCRQEAEYKREIHALRAKLKVSEDALKKVRWQTSAYIDTDTACSLACECASNALAAIREEGGAK